MPGNSLRVPPAGPLVVLLEPHRGANVGAACRAIKNMGGGGLVVVGGDYDADEARRTSVHASDVFASRNVAASFDDAVARASLVIGTSPRETPWHMPVAEIGEVFADAAGRGLGGTSIALVFGPEDRGLSNTELARCHRVAFVPTAGSYASLNLAQAVVVCLYEWLQVSRGKRPGGSSDDPVPSESGPEAAAACARAQAEAIDDLRDVLVEIGFLEGDQAGRIMASIASMLTRSGLDEREVRIVRGLARQIRWAARRGGALHGR